MNMTNVVGDTEVNKMRIIDSNREVEDVNNRVDMEMIKVMGGT